MLNRTLKRTRQARGLRSVIVILIVAAMLISGGAVTSARAETALCIYDYTTQTSYIYREQLITYVYDGKTLPLGEIPGILSENGVALASFQAVFANAIGLDCTFDETTNTILIQNEVNSLLMTIGSKTAFLNEKAVTMNTAPIQVKYMESNKKRVLVPTRFVAEAFGYQYVWNSQTATVVITTPPTLLIDGEAVPYNKKDTTVFLNAATCNLKTLPVIKISDVVMGSAYRIFGTSGEIEDMSYRYSKNAQSVRIAVGELELIYFVGSTTAWINGMPVDCAVAPCMVENPLSGESGVYVPLRFTAEALGFSYTSRSDLSEVTLTATGETGVYTEQRLAANSKESVVVDDNQVYIPLPEGIAEETIWLEDLYEQSKLVLHLKGSYKDFYLSNEPQTVHKKVQSILVKEENGETTLSITTNQLQGAILTVCDTYALLTIAHPSELFSKIVVLDAGHGGKDPGAIRSGINEKDINLKIMMDYLRPYLEHTDIKVYYTRTSDVFVSLADRAAFAERVGADFFVSLHANTFSNTSVQGTEVYYCTTNTAVTKNGKTSKELATIFAKQVSSAFGTKNRGIFTANFDVLKLNTVPAVLIELGYMSNASDLNRLTNGVNQKNAATAIYETICALFD